MMVRQGNRYSLEGAITLQTVGSLISDEMLSNPDNVIVDLAGVTAVDSSALSLLLEWMRRRPAGSGSIVFTNLGDNLRSLSELYGVADLIPTAAA